VTAERTGNRRYSQSDLDVDYDEGDNDVGGEERTPLPIFGCACENALIVDSVCPACIAYLQEQDTDARRAKALANLEPEKRHDPLDKHGPARST